MESIIDFAQLAFHNILTYGVSFLVVLGILVFVHEWGHYIVARLCGVRVDTFSIGFGREIWGRTSKAGTRWKISLFPLGGYVKMFGDVNGASAGHTEQVQDGTGHTREMTEEEKCVAFFTKPVWKRSLIVFAGPAINFLFAIILLAGLYMGVGRPITPPEISAVEVGSASYNAGFQPRDMIKTIDGDKFATFDEMRREVLLTLDQELKFVVVRDGQDVEIKVTPQKITDKDRFGFVHERGYLGLIGPGNGIDMKFISAVNGVETGGDIQKAHQMVVDNIEKSAMIETMIEGRKTKLLTHIPRDINKQLFDDKDPTHNVVFLGVKPNNEFRKYNPFSAVGIAIKETYNITADTLGAIWQMVTGTRSAKELGGIIRIGAMAGDMAQQGIISLILFTALLSINLGLINLFPIPLLDGGHLVFYGIEAVNGKPVSEQVQEYAFRFGLVVLVCLMVFSNLNDILQMFVFKGGDS